MFYYMAPSCDFLASIAKGLIIDTTCTLSERVILLPTNRACHRLKQLISQYASGDILQLPTIIALGDLTGLHAFVSSYMVKMYPPIDPIEEQLLLLSLLEQYDAQLVLDPTFIKTWHQFLAHQLDNDAALFTPQFNKNITLFQLLFEHMPNIVNASGKSLGEAYHFALINAFIAKIQAESLSVTIAGSTVSIPQTFALCKALQFQPHCDIILPAYTPFNVLDETHPHYMIGQLLHKLNLSPDDLTVYPHQLSQLEDRREQLIETLLLPQEFITHSARIAVKKSDESKTQEPRTQEPGINQTATNDQIWMIPCLAREDEVQLIVRLVTETLEDPKKSVMVICNDTELTTQIKVALDAYHIVYNSLSPERLNQSLVGRLFLAFLQVISVPYSDTKAIAWLKDISSDPTTLIAYELMLKRKKQPTSCPSLLDRFRCIYRELEAIEDIHSYHQQLTASFTTFFPEYQSYKGGVEWYKLMEDLQRHLPRSCSLTPSSYSKWVKYFVEGCKIVSATTTARLQITTLMHSRLLLADRVICCGMGEGSMPQHTHGDRFIPSAVKQKIGLSTDAMSLGKDAHNLLLLYGAPSLIFTYSMTHNGVGQLPSSWWVKMHFICKNMAIGRCYPAYQRDIAACDARPTASSFSPPLEVRNFRLSVTAMERLVANPYSIYASHILKLKPLEPISEAMEAKDFGILVHRALEIYFKDTFAPTEAMRYDALIEAGEVCFSEVRKQQGMAALWWPRYLAIAQSLAVFSEALFPCDAEIAGSAVIEGWSLYGKADAIFYQDGEAVIVDFKTGQFPTNTALYQGISSQLAMLGLLYEKGAFHKSKPLKEVALWRITGSAIEVKSITGKELIDLLDVAKEGLQCLYDYYQQSEHSYLSYPFGLVTSKDSSYDHFARVIQ